MSSGRYKFRYRKKTPSGAVAYDTTAVRHNGDIWAVRAEENLYGRLTAGLWQHSWCHREQRLAQRGTAMGP